MSDNITKEEEIEVRKKLSEMDSITEEWERNLFATAIVDAMRWGEKIEKENKDYRKRNRLTNKY